MKELVEKTNPEELSDADVDALKAGKEKLMEAAQAVFTKMYEQQAQAARWSSRCRSGHG